MAPQADSGHVRNAQPDLAASYPNRRRITADSFRLLTARLQSKEPIPDLMEPPREAPAEQSIPADSQAAIVETFAPDPTPVPQPEPVFEAPPIEVVAEQPEIPFIPATGFSLPEFVPLNEQYVAPSPAIPAVAEALPEAIEIPAEAELAVPASEPPAVEAVEEQVNHHHESQPESGALSAAPGAWPDFPAFGGSLVTEPHPVEPSAPHELANSEAARETALESVEASTVQELISETAPEVTVAPELQSISAEPVPEIAAEVPGKIEQLGTLAEVIEASTPSRAASPLAEKVLEAMIKTVAEAVYAKPSASERAAFLREIADLVEKNEEVGAEPDQLPPEPVELGPETVLEDFESPPIAPTEEAVAITQVIAERLGPSSPILRKSKEQDPFAEAKAAKRPGYRVEELPEADADTGELALSLLDMMSGGSSTSQPQERALAADTLLRLVPRIPAKQLLTISERVAIMETPPSLLVAKLIRDNRHEIAAPLLERCMHITDQDLATATAEGDVHKLRMIARRRVISPTLSDQLIDRGDTSVILTLVRNPGATLNHGSFFRLADHAIEHHAVLAPLATRGDLPAPVAFELFWHVPHELRRFLLSRFLTDSENLNRILKITMATQAPADGSTGAEPKFPSQDLLESAIKHVVDGELETGAQILAEAAGIEVETVLRALADRNGEPVAVLLKTLGFQRSRFSEAVVSLQNAGISLLSPERKVEELQSIYDTLSFNKARILVTYWDWYTRKAGPYAPHN